MIPNNQPDADAPLPARSSTRSSSSTRRPSSTRPAPTSAPRASCPSRRRWRSSSRRSSARRHGDRFYPDLSGVARSYNFYPVGPRAARGRRRRPRPRPRQDDRRRRARAGPSPPPTRSAAAVRLRRATCVDDTQTEFWAVNMGPPPRYDPMTRDRVPRRAPTSPRPRRTGRCATPPRPTTPTPTGSSPALGRPGPRVLDFAPILAWNELPLIAGAAQAAGRVRGGSSARRSRSSSRVSLPPRRAGARFGFLQVRPLLVSREAVEVVEPRSSTRPRARRGLVGRPRQRRATRSRDVVYVEPDALRGPADADDRRARSSGSTARSSRPAGPTC